jgi:hypothetical protein
MCRNFSSGISLFDPEPLQLYLSLAKVPSDQNAFVSFEIVMGNQESRIAVDSDS